MPMRKKFTPGTVAIKVVRRFKGSCATLSDEVTPETASHHIVKVVDALPAWVSVVAFLHLAGHKAVPALCAMVKLNRT
jgi:hypothetical protein